MKVFFMICLLICCNQAGAQDYCKRIKTEVSPDKTMHEYSSPYDPLKIPAIRVSRKYSTDPDIAFDNFSVIFQIPAGIDDIYAKTPDGGQAEKEEKGVIIEFDDKTKLVENELTINHDISEDHMQAVRSVYYPLTDENVKELAAKKIAKFSLSGKEQTVTADSATAIQHYIQCMKAMK